MRAARRVRRAVGARRQALIIRRRRSPPRRPAAPARPIRRSSPHRVITGEFDTSLERALRDAPVRRAGRHDRRARALLPRPARGAHERADQARARPRAVGGAPGAGRALGGARVPRLGRLEPSRRDGVAQRVLERGASTSRTRKLHRQGHTTRGFRPGPDPGRRVGGRAGCRGGRVAARGRLRRPGRVAGRDRHLDRSAVGGGPVRARALRRDSGPAGGRAGTRATSTSTPSIPRSATRP